MIWKIWKKDKLNSETDMENMEGKLMVIRWKKNMKNTEETEVELWNDMENMESKGKLKCEMIRLKQYGQLASRIVKRSVENTEENCEKIWKDMKNMEEKYFLLQNN